MRFFKFILLFVLLFDLHSAFSQTIITVTSKKDAGNGTLRAALASIPGNNTAATYIIKFNLPGNATDENRTIRLQSQLPSIPSNVTIDGSSQPVWPALGVSGAKIIIEPLNPNPTFSGLVIGQYNGINVQAKNVNIYGLYIRNFATITSLQNVNTNFSSSGIVINYSSNIKIGAPGKGNVISGNINGILIQNSDYYNEVIPSTDITIQSNLIGVIYDGKTPNSNLTGISANVYTSSFNIGGDNDGEGNVISANQTNLSISRSYYYTTNTILINIINNNIGTDITGKKDFHELPLFTSAPSNSEFYGVKLDASYTNLYMRNNTISGNRTRGISIANASFILTGNAIGTDKDGVVDLKNGIGIRIESGATGTIGGTTAAETNLIAYNDYGIESLSEKPVKITRNSMFCNTIFGIGKSPNNVQAHIQILKQRPDYVSGRATPNSEVELFYSINCGGTCEGKTYFKTVQANSDGRWESVVPLNNHVIATASLLNRTTSEFSSAALLTDEAVIEPVTCHGNGSITISEPREGFTFTWNKIESNGGRTLIKMGNEQQITGLEIGSYEVIIDDGCKAITQQFDIKDQKLTDPTVTWPDPACGETVFTFSASVTKGKGTLTYQWIDDTGQIVATGNSVSLPEGTYKVKVTDESGCTTESAFETIKRKPQPIIYVGSMQVTAAACGKENGAIKNITVTDETQPATYKWYAYDQVRGQIGAVVAQTKDLENVAGGYYIFEVTDASACSPVRSDPLYIGIYDSVIIDGGISTPATCNTANGSINNIRLSEADTYEWFNSLGVSLEKGPYSTGMALQLKDLAPGTYTLLATNSVTGCNSSQNFTINQMVPQVYSVTPIVNPTTCELNNGHIILRYGSVQPTRFEWKDAAGTVIPGSVTELKDLSAGIYTFYAYDINGCETVFGPYTIENTPKLVIEPNTGFVTNDGCSLLRGAITGVQINGGIPPYNFTWENEAGQTVKSNQPTSDLTGVPEGKYRLIVKDNTACGIAMSDYFTIENPSFAISAPVVNDMHVCYATEIMLQALAPEEGTYQLYKDVTDATPILESTTGLFVFKISKTGDYNIRRRLGTCYSEFTKVHIEVTNDNLEVMNTITPNGDGRNDVWLIKGLPDYNDISIKLYTRSGQLVYESLGKYNNPFDGHFRGKELPAGVYYYIIDLRADCKPLGGSLTLLR